MAMSVVTVPRRVPRALPVHDQRLQPVPKMPRRSWSSDCTASEICSPFYEVNL
jgi:hypothetical protein